jgi:hypothetical protein
MENGAYTVPMAAARKTAGKRAAIAAGLLAAAAGFGAIVGPAIAQAEPSTAQKYSDCVKKIPPSDGTTLGDAGYALGGYDDAKRQCCLDSGGVWRAGTSTCRVTDTDKIDQGQVTVQPGTTPTNPHIDPGKLRGADQVATSGQLT